MKLLPNEAFHSYLLRYFICRGDFPEIFKSIISKSGVWNDFIRIKVPMEISNRTGRERFDLVRQTLMIDDRLLRTNFDLISYNIISTYKGFEYSGNKQYRDDFFNFPINRKIRFCPSCIITSINNYGVGYFKKQWFSKYIECCEKHQCKLQLIQNESDIDIYQSLIDIISGRHCGGGALGKITYKNISLESFLLEIISNASNCLWQELVRFSLSFIKITFQQYEIKNITYDYSQIYKMILTSKGVFKKVLPIDEPRLLKFMANFFPYELKLFLESNSKSIKNKKTLSDGSQIKYKLYMLINGKCDACLLKENQCLNSLRIAVDDITEVKKLLVYDGRLKENKSYPIWRTVSWLYSGGCRDQKMRRCKNAV